MCNRSPFSRYLAAVTCSILAGLGAARADEPPRDPLLVPAPSPRQTLRAWRDGANILRARSTDLAIAVADVAQAEAQSRGALAALLGQIALGGNYSVNILTQQSALLVGATTTTNGNGQSVSTPVYDFTTLPQRHFGAVTATATIPIVAPRPWVAVKTAHLNEAAVTADLANAQRTLRQGLAATIIATVAAERSAELSRKSLIAALDRVDLVTRKKALGGGTLIDVVRGQQDLEAARADVVATDETLRQSREALGLALGLKEEVGVSKDLRLDDAIAEVRTACRKVPELDKRADLVAASRRVDVAHQVVKDAEAEFYPTLSVQSVLSSTNQDTGFPATQWFVQGLLSWNLWDGGLRYADLRNGEAQTTVAQSHREQAERNATIEVARALRAVQVAHQSRDVAERETSFATQQARLTHLAYETGQGTSLELIAAAAAERAQELNLVLRQYDVVSAELTALFVQSSCTL